MNLSKTLGTEDAVRFLTSVDDNKLPDTYRNCDVFVLPSVYRSEAFGMSQLEAMSCGKPIISTNIHGSGVSFVNKNEFSGIVVTPRDEKALASAMIKLMKNKKLRLRLGANARKRALDIFSEKITNKKVLEIY